MTTPNTHHSLYKAPKGFSKFSSSDAEVSSTEFLNPEFVQAQKEGKQVWIIRAPADFNVDSLDGMTLEINESALNGSTPNEDSTNEQDDGTGGEELALLGWNITDETKSRKPFAVLPKGKRSSNQDQLALYDITNESRKLGTAIASLEPLVRKQSSSSYKIVDGFTFDRLVSVEEMDDIHE